MPQTAAIQELSADVRRVEAALNAAVRELPNIEQRLLERLLTLTQDHASDLRGVESDIARNNTQIAVIKQVLEEHGRNLATARTILGVVQVRVDGVEKELDGRRSKSPRFLWSNVAAAIIGSVSFGFPFFRLYLKLPLDESGLWTACFVGTVLASFLSDPTKRVNFSIAGFLSEVTGKKGASK